MVFPRIELSPLVHLFRIVWKRLIADKWWRWRRRWSIHQLWMHLIHWWWLIGGICRMISTVQDVHWWPISGIVLHGWRRRWWMSHVVSIRRSDKASSYRSRSMDRRRWHGWRWRTITIGKVTISSGRIVWIEIEISSIGTVLKWCWRRRHVRVRRMLMGWDWR